MKRNPEQKINSIVAAGFVIVNLLIQIIGYIDYEKLPGFFWSLSDCIIVMAPLLFGLAFGLICMIPVAAAELVWYVQLLSVGPLLHIVSFVVTVCICAALYQLMSGWPAVRRALVTGAVFELSLLAESLLYYCLRYLFLSSHHAVTWESVSEPFLSLANPLVLCAGISFVIAGGDSPRARSVQSPRKS